MVKYKCKECGTVNEVKDEETKSELSFPIEVQKPTKTVISTCKSCGAKNAVQVPK
jgi:RNase P subunit RPR2